MKSLSELLYIGSGLVAALGAIAAYLVARTMKKRTEMYEKKYREYLERQLRVKNAIKH